MRAFLIGSVKESFYPNSFIYEGVLLDANNQLLYQAILEATAAIAIDSEVREARIKLLDCFLIALPGLVELLTGQKLGMRLAEVLHG